MTISQVVPLLEQEASDRSETETPLGDAGFGALETVRGRLPLQALDVRARIDGLLAQVVLRQTFVNVSAEPTRGHVRFSLAGPGGRDRLSHGSGPSPD